MSFLSHRDHSSESPPTVVVVFGPPLPGRAALARALERRLPCARRVAAPGGKLSGEGLARALAEGLLPVVEASLPTVGERGDAALVVGALGVRCRWVFWVCDPEQVQREIYRRYASLPRRFGDHWLGLWRWDRGRREPLGDELPADTVVPASGGGSILDHVVRVAASLGIPGPLHARPTRNHHVLVVDDDDDDRAMIAATFEAAGCTVHVADGAETALGIAESEPLDLVVTDHIMPGRSGLELATELVHRRPEIHVALLTGHAEGVADLAVRARSVDVLLAKPARAADLVRLLDELAEASKRE